MEVWLLRLETVCVWMGAPGELLKNTGRVLTSSFIWWLNTLSRVPVYCCSPPGQISCIIYHLYSWRLFLNFHSRKVSVFYFFLWPAVIFTPPKVYFFPPMRTCLHYSAFDLTWKFLYISLNVLLVPYHSLSLCFSSFSFITKFCVPRILHFT